MRSSQLIKILNVNTDANGTRKVIELLDTSDESYPSGGVSYVESSNESFAENVDASIPALENTQLDVKTIKKLGFLGKGTFGEVSKAMISGGPYTGVVAIKSMHTPFGISLRAKAESRLLEQLNIECGDYVTNYYGYYTQGSTYNIAMEYMSYNNVAAYFGSGSKYLVTPQNQANAIVQMIGCMWALHKSKVIHRDIKTDNFLMNKNDDDSFTIKLSDFGLSKFSEERQDEPAKYHHSLQTKLLQKVGSPLYWSPEVISAEKYSYASDMFAFGFCIWNVITRSDRFYENKINTVDDLERALLVTKQRTSIPHTCPPKVSGWITTLWSETPANRPSAEKLKNDAEINRKSIIPRK